MDFKSLFEMSLISEAAYYEYTSSGVPSEIAAAKWTSAVNELASGLFSILYSQPNNFTGFQASIYTRKNPESGEAAYIIGFSGTSAVSAGNPNVTHSDSSDDVSNIVSQLSSSNPIPIQLFDAINWVRQVTAPAGQQYRKLYWLSDFGDVGYSAPSNADKLIKSVQVFDSSSVHVFNLYEGPSDDLALGIIPPGESYDVVGQSLGGFYAQAFALLNPDNNVGVAYSFNAPGVTSQMESWLHAIKGESLSATTIKNVYAYPGPEIITAESDQRGERIPVYAESGAHDKEYTTDALAVSLLYQSLSSSLSLGEINKILEQTSASPDRSLESALDKLACIFDSGWADTLGNDYGGGEDFQGREAFFNKIGLLKSNPLYESSLGGLQFVVLSQVGDVANLAASDIAYRYALYNLNPFALLGVDYTAHNEGSKLELSSESAPEGLTNTWIHDRWAMLSWLIQGNYVDAPSSSGILRVGADLGAYPESYRFIDERSGISVIAAPFRDKEHMIYFGDDAANNKIGGSDSDRMYGGLGDDVLEAGHGNDYLEGGSGVDTYIWSKGDGSDKLVELDEASNTEGGRLKINNQLISKVVRQNSGVYEAAGCVFLRVPAPDGGELLVVRDKEGEGGVKVFGYNHTSNNFGIEWVDKPSGPSDSGAGKAASASIPPRRDPLALDLDGDGIETTGVSGDTVVLFDHDGDGIRTGTGWVKPDDGWLAMDRNGNGTIDNGSELFGVDTLLQNGSHATDGFAALAEWDSNHDGAITSADTVFSQLRIWRDLNQDGISQTGELQTLTDLNIVGIGVSATAGSLNLGNGNIQTGAGVFTRSDGSSGSTVEMESLTANLDLLSNTFYSQYPDTISLTTSAAALPNVGGSGRVRSLREAASLSSALDAVATDYAQQTTRSAQMSRLDDLMTSWAATSDLGSLQQQFARVNAQGNPATLTYSLAGYTAGTPQYTEMLRRIAVVESFMGFNYLGSGVSSAVLSAGTGSMTVTLAAPQLQAISEAYDIFKGDVYSAMLFDTRLKPYVQAIQYQATPDDVVADFSQVETLFNQAIASNATLGVVDLIEFVSAFGAGSLQALGWQTLPYLVSKLPQAPAVAGLVEKLAGDLSVIVAADNQSLVQATGHSNVLIAAHTDTTLYGLSGDDVLVGQEGNDVLEGGKGNNVFYGGTGNDLMYGLEGSNTYIYVAGEGSDVIRNEEGDVANVDVVRIKGVDPAQTSYVRNGGMLVFSFTGKTQTLTISNFFSGSGEDLQGLDSFVFDDGTVWSTDDIYDQVLLATANADYLAGFSRDDVINGQDGNDIILGKGGGNPPIFHCCQK